MADQTNDQGKVHNTAAMAIGNVLGILTCLQLLEDIDGFNKWMRSSHGITASYHFFDGYKLTVETLIRMLHWEIMNNQSLGLSEDELFSRAAFTGIPFYKLPNSCEKNILLRNISFKGEPVIKAKDWESLKKNLERFQDEVISALSLIKQVTEVSIRSGMLDKETAIRYAAMFQVYIFLNDTRRELPHGYHVPVFKTDRAPFWTWSLKKKLSSRFAQLFEGYKYSVQFLWYKLAQDRFGATTLARLHQANNWTEFDRFFESIREEVIQPLERESRGTLGFDSIIILTKSPRDLIKDLITKGPPERRPSQKDSLERTFLWYDVQLIDGSDFNFAGVAAFIPMLIGLVQVKQDLGLQGKIRVIRLIHGSSIAHRRDYSYAVLVEVGGFISDASGWILFWDCCSDAGSTSALFKQAAEHIQKYEEKSLISIKTLRIDKKRFLTLMRHRLVSLTKEQIYDLRVKT